jgi:hypothetical protein
VAISLIVCDDKSDVALACLLLWALLCDDRLTALSHFFLKGRENKLLGLQIDACKAYVLDDESWTFMYKGQKYSKGRARVHNKSELHLSDKGRGSRRIILESRGNLLLGLVIPRESVDP